MALIDHIDGPNRDIYLTSDSFVSDLHPMDIYREMRELRRTDESLRKYNLFLQAKGHEETGPGVYTEMYVVQLEGTRFIPYDTSHELKVIGKVITDDGQSGVSCFDRSPLSPTTVVDISYLPPQVEVIEKGTSGLTTEESAALLALQVDVEWIKEMEQGQWKIENNQMIFYNTSLVEIARFNLFDNQGNPTMEHVFERVPV